MVTLKEQNSITHIVSMIFDTCSKFIVVTLHERNLIQAGQYIVLR